MMRLLRSLLTLVICAPGAWAEETHIVVAASSRDSAARARVEAALRSRGQAVVPLPHEQETAASIAAVGRATRIARDHFLAARYAEAIRNLESVESEHLAALLGPASGRSALVTLNLWLGALHAASESNAAALDRFALARHLDPKAQLDESFWPPAYIALFEQARTQERAAATFALTSKAPGVRFRWNGSVPRKLGPPLQTEEGLHYLLVERLGFASIARPVTLRAGIMEALEVTPNLQRQPGVSAAMTWYGEAPRAATTTVARVTGVSRVVVVSGPLVTLHDATGRTLSTARGTPLSTTASTLFPRSSEPKESKSLLKRWWFWTAVGVGAGVLAGGAVWATRDRDLRGNFVVEGSM